MHIQVYDGWTFNASQRLLRLSGKNTIHTPFSVKSSVPRMLVRFITDDSINNFLGFFATYTQTNSAIDCNRIINGTNDGFISSPNFPSNYGINNLDCRSFITVPNGFRVLLTFTYFQTERNFDFVEVSFRFIDLKTFRNCYKHNLFW